MIESILFPICSVWLPVLLVSLHHSEWRQQSRLYEWTEPPPEAGRWHWSHCDVTPETKRREGALWPPLPIHLSASGSQSLCPALVASSCDGLIFQVCDSPTFFSRPSPIEDAPLLSSPAVSCLAQLWLFQINGHFPQLPDSRFPTCTLAWLMFYVFICAIIFVRCQVCPEDKKVWLGQ